MSESLIALEGIKKVFYTDEVETHALSDIHLEIRKGEYVAIAGPSIPSMASRSPGCPPRTGRGSATGRSVSSSRPST
jgi:hypothetical protein